MIFNIQRFSLHDGAGVRTLVFFKGCPLRCPWCSNPESQSFRPEFLFDSGKCIGCRECFHAAVNREVAWDDGPRPDRSAAFDASRFRRLCPAEALTVAGQEMDADAILGEAEKDRPFYRGDGGITLSGGEPFAQPRLARELLEKAKGRGLSTGVETCLAVSWDNIAPCLPFLDWVYADVKHVDPRSYRDATGGDLETAAANLRRLAAWGVPVSARVPVIPGFNADFETLSSIAALIASTESIGTMHLLPYHSFGEGKYRLLGRDYPCTGIPSPRPEDLSETAARLAAGHGLDVRIGG